MIKLTILFSLIILLPFVSYCQKDTAFLKPAFQQMDLKDWLINKGWIRKKPEKNSFLLLIPIVASNPAAGFIFGAGLSYAYKSRPKDTRLSSITANASYSTKGLLNLNVKSNSFVLKEKLFLNGDWRYLVNVETTYGLGTQRYTSSGGDVGINGYETSKDSSGQSLKYNQVRLHETASWKIIGNLFAGLGIQYDYYYHIQDASLQVGDTVHSHHYQYSLKHGFNASKYTSSGFSINFLFDSRDNQVNAYKGYFANINYRINLTALGSTQNSSILLTEYRSFHALDGQKRRHILAFWLYGNFVAGGNVPYLLLPALGYDQRQKTGRGYTFGRFRGESMVYGESEYRFPISAHTGILGGVAFINATTTSDKADGVRTFDYLRVGYGGGLRIMLDKKSRTRLEIDAGISDRKVGFYLGAQETF